MDASDYWVRLEKLCAHFAPKVNQSFEEAMKLFNDSQSENMFLFNKTDMASVMHACIRDRIRKNFYGVAGTFIVDKPGRAFMLILDGGQLGIDAIVGIKFKKQDRNLKTNNIQTQTVIAFNSQQTAYLRYLPEIQLALPLPEFQDQLANPPKSNNLIAGYTPNTEFTKHERLTMTYPFDNGKFKLLSEITHITAKPADNVRELRKKDEGKPTKRVQRRRKSADSNRTKLRKFIANSEDDSKPQVKSGAQKD